MKSVFFAAGLAALFSGGVPGISRAGIVWSESFDAALPRDLKAEFTTAPGAQYSLENYSSMSVSKDDGTGTLVHSIPEAPNPISGSLPQRGLLMRAIYAKDFTVEQPAGTATAAAERILNLIATDVPGGSRLALTDNYRFSFDFYLRLPPAVTFSASSGLPNEAGTTEQMLWGVGYAGTGGAFPVGRGWRSSRGTGMWGWLTTEGGFGTTNGSDASLYKSTGLLFGRNLGYTSWSPTAVPVADTSAYFTPAFGAGAQPMASAPANQWCTAVVTVLAGKVSVSYKGAGGTTTEFFSAVDGSGQVEGSVMVGYEDAASSVSFDQPNQWMLVDNMVVEDITPPTMDVTADVPFVTFTGSPQNGSYIVTNRQITGSLTVSGVTFGGPNAADFGLLTPLPLVIPAGETAALAVQFNPTGADGLKTATLNITSDDPQRPAFPPITLQVRKSVGSLLMAHYRLNDTLGTTVANSVGAAGAFQVRDPLGFSQPGLFSGSGSAIRFLPAQTGTTGNYITSSVVHTPSFTVSLWAVPESTGGLRTLFQRDGDFSGSLDGIYGLLLDTDGSLVWRADGVEVFRSEPVIQDLQPETAGTPVHIVLSHKDSDGFGNTTADTTRLFVNGQLLVERLSPDAAGFGDYVLNPTVSAMHIASRTTAGNGYQGVLDDIQIYGDALTPEQVNSLYTQPGRNLLNLLTSPLAVTGFTYNPQASSISLSWSSEAGAVYAIEESVNLTQWTDVAGQTGIASGGATTSTTITGVSAADRKFYRAKRTSPQ